MKSKLILSGLILGLASGSVSADDSHRGDAHAPIGVMGDHLHDSGEVMLSYRYMDMQMAGNRDDSDSIPISDILMPAPGTYMVAPEDMNMRMHMLGGMYAPNDSLTLMLMLNMISTEMSHRTAMGGQFSTSADGWGDSSITGLYKLFEGSSGQLILNLGLSMPTGSIEAEDVTPASAPNKAQLPYPMQLGSGTWDLIPGLTWRSVQESYSWGAQTKATVRLGENDRDYTLGNRFLIQGWYARPLIEHLSWSTRLSYEKWGNIDGADAALNVNMVPTADPDLRAGSRLDLGVGINWIHPLASGSELRVSTEYVIPVQQRLDGPQMEQDSTLTVGLQFLF